MSELRQAYKISVFYINIMMSLILLQDVVGVILGGTLGHAFCTGLAVMGGRFIAQRISIRTGEYENSSKFKLKHLLS